MQRYCFRTMIVITLLLPVHRAAWSQSPSARDLPRSVPVPQSARTMLSLSHPIATAICLGSHQLQSCSNGKCQTNTCATGEFCVIPSDLSQAQCVTPMAIQPQGCAGVHVRKIQLVLNQTPTKIVQELDVCPAAFPQCVEGQCVAANTAYCVDVDNTHYAKLSKNPGAQLDFSFAKPSGVVVQGNNALFDVCKSKDFLQEQACDGNNAVSIAVKCSALAPGSTCVTTSAGGACNIPAFAPTADFDNDGIVNQLDKCPLLTKANQLDTDQDGVGDTCDNCPSVANAEQTDANANQVGDACETETPPLDQTDTDGDGVIDAKDDCPTVKNPDQKNSHSPFNNVPPGDACTPCLLAYFPPSIAATPSTAPCSLPQQVSGNGPWGGESDNLGARLPTISADGRYVAFDGHVTPFSWFAARRVIRVDWATGESDDTVASSKNVEAAQLSANGQIVTVVSSAADLVDTDTNDSDDVFRRVLSNGGDAKYERVSVGNVGQEGNGASRLAVLSAGGEFIAFTSDATNLVENDTNGQRDVFLRDLTANTTERVNVGANGVQGNQDSWAGAVSADGRYILLMSQASNFSTKDLNSAIDIYLADRQTHTLTLMSTDAAGNIGNGNAFDGVMTPDAHYVLFTSDATNVVPGDTNGKEDVFLRDRVANTIERVSLNEQGAQGNDDSYGGSVSADGRYVAFVSKATGLTATDTNSKIDLFVRDRKAGKTALVSVAADGSAFGHVGTAKISADGRFIVFNAAPQMLMLQAEAFVAKNPLWVSTTGSP